jgi:hypothetical protein
MVDLARSDDDYVREICFALRNNGLEPIIYPADYPDYLKVNDGGLVG